MLDARHPIQWAARLTGLTTHVIRISEQGYQAVGPRRTAAEHRLYSQKDIERLGLLRDVTHAGHNISQVARLLNDHLRALAANASGLELRASRAAADTPAPDALLDLCLVSRQSLDGCALDRTLKRATTAMGALLGAAAGAGRIPARFCEGLHDAAALGQQMHGWAR